jgi:uncharacterized protein YycO
MAQIIFSTNNLPLAVGIRFLTWSDWSHAGILTKDNTVIDSTWSLKRNGVLERSLDEFLSGTTRHNIRTFPQVPDEVIEIARGQIGKPYDWTPIFGLPFHRNWQDDDAWFCSELVAWSCVQAGSPLINKESWRVTPQDLWEAIAIAK